MDEPPTQVYALVTYRIWVIISFISKEAMYISLQMSATLPHTMYIACAFYRTTKIHSNCLFAFSQLNFVINFEKRKQKPNEGALMLFLRCKGIKIVSKLALLHENCLSKRVA